MSPRTLLALFVLALTLQAQTKPDDCDARIPGTPLVGVNPVAPRILDIGSAKTVELHIFGHSENRGYDKFLQPMVDKSPPLSGVKFKVFKHAIGGHQAFNWAKKNSRGFNTIESILKNHSGDPMLALCLFSNNAAFPIRKPNTTDANFVRLATELESIADHLFAAGKGFKMVYFSSHRYKPANFLPSFYERHATNHMIGQAAKKKKPYIKAGPEQHDLHWCCFPVCYANDRAHTNAQGAQLMASAWYNLLIRELTGCYNEPYGKGVAGTGGTVPVLLPSSGFAKLGNSSYGLRCSKGRASAPLVYLLGLTKLSGPLLVLPAIILVRQTDRSGANTLGLPIPNDNALHGATLQSQAAVQDPAGKFLGFALTQGLSFAICR